MAVIFYLCSYISYPLCIQQRPLYPHSSKSMSDSELPNSHVSFFIKKKNQSFRSIRGGQGHRGSCLLTHTAFKMFPQAAFKKISVQFSTVLLLADVKKGERFVKRFCTTIPLPPLQLVCAEPVEFHSHRGLFVSVLVFYLGLSWTVCECACRLSFVAQSAASLPLP